MGFFFDEGDYEQCRNCGEKYYYPLNGELFNWNSYCENCASKCDVCGEYEPNDSLQKIGSRKVCESCMDKAFNFILKSMDEEKDKDGKTEDK